MDAVNARFIGFRSFMIGSAESGLALPFSFLIERSHVKTTST
jgi:hypothetical protein